MLKFLSLVLILIANGLVAVAQDITVSQNPVVIHTVENVDYANENIFIYNNTTDSLLIRWTRYVDSMEVDWETAICDNTTCHPAAVSSSQFIIEPNLYGSFMLIFYPNGQPGDGALHILVEAVDRPDIEPVNVEYLFFVNELTGFSDKSLLDGISPIYAENAIIFDLPKNIKKISYDLVAIDGRLLDCKNSIISSNGLIKIPSNYLKSGFYVIYLEVETDFGRQNKAYKLLIPE